MKQHYREKLEVDKILKKLIILILYIWFLPLYEYNYLECYLMFLEILSLDRNNLQLIDINISTFATNQKPLLITELLKIWWMTNFSWNRHGSFIMQSDAEVSLSKSMDWSYTT